MAKSFNPESYMPFDDWHDCTIGDAKAIAALMGWKIDHVYFSGFWSQGDGANFEGSFDYAKGCAKAVRAYAPVDTKLHNIADRWQALQSRCIYQLRGSVKHSGRYQHENCASFDWEDNRDSWRALPDGVEDDATDIARDFMRWIYRQLETEYEYQQASSLAFGWHELGEGMADSRAKARQLVRDMREAIKGGLSAAPSICSALRDQLRSLLSDWEEQREEREAIADNFHYYQNGKSLDVAQFAALHI